MRHGGTDGGREGGREGVMQVKQSDLNKAAICFAILSSHHMKGNAVAQLTSRSPLTSYELLVNSISFHQVTGNLEPIAWMKMEAMSLLPHFSVPRIGG